MEKLGGKKNQTGLSSKKTQCFNYWRAMRMIYGCHLVAEPEDSAQDLPSYCSVLPFSERARPRGKPLKEEVKNLLHSSAAGINLCQGKKGSSLCLPSVKVGHSPIFLPIIHLLSFCRLEAPRGPDFILISTVGPDLGSMSFWNINELVMLPFRKVSVLKILEPWGNFSFSSAPAPCPSPCPHQPSSAGASRWGKQCLQRGELQPWSFLALTSLLPALPSSSCHAASIRVP